jgi:diacylglycerol kinase family enzyme
LFAPGDGGDDPVALVESDAPLEMDGEVVGALPLEVEALPGALSITASAGLPRSR